MTALTLAALGTVRETGAIDAVVASLPVSLAFGRSAVDLVAVDGSTGWTTEVLRAREAGARGVLVVDPREEDVSAGHALGFPVVLDRPFSGNPGVEDVRSALADVEPRALLEARVVVPTGTALRHALLEQLALVRAAHAPLESAALVISTPRGYTVRGRLRTGRAVLLTGAVSDAVPTSATLRAVGADVIVDACIPSPETARPLRATITTSNGQTMLPTRYETAHRFSWRRLIALVRAEESSTDLEDFAADRAVIASLSPLLH
ncbi:hypothetical protein [Rathayibacter sp. Leaf248]|uniref:hypothetical protein n=1 Tax=Rathayibacter sp. Leaf248 TaxID=2876555 RepID=UPI001E2A7320|nr:hypothetical protein [Rathayibacter sp. Leaf248]